MSNGYPEPGAAKKKGLHPLAWVAIGCGGLAVAGLVLFVVLGMFAANKLKDVAEDFEANPAKATAEMFVRLNPELEKVESDDDAGTITVRNKRTGEVGTFDYDELEEGRFSWKTDEGEVTFDASTGEGGEAGVVKITGPEGEMSFGATDVDLPDWVPLYPGASEPEGTFSSTGQEGTHAAVSFKTDDATQEVLDFYVEALEEAGFEVGTQTYTQGDSLYGTITGQNDAEGRTLNVVARPEGSATVVVVQFTDKP